MLIYNSNTLSGHIRPYSKPRALQSMDTLTPVGLKDNSDPATICKDSLGLTFIIVVVNYQTLYVLSPNTLYTSKKQQKRDTSNAISNTATYPALGTN